MEALQAVASLIQGAQALLQGVEALSRASRDLSEAPQKIAQLEETLGDLTKLHATLLHNHSSKLHHPELLAQLHSFEALIRDEDFQLGRAKKLVLFRRRKGPLKMKMYLNVVVTAVTGDELSEIVKSMNSQLLEWINKNSIKATIAKAFDKTAEKLTSYLRVQAQPGYHPVASKARKIRALLEDETSSSRKVVLIHGLSGMGKSCLARYVAADPPKRFVHGAVDLLLGQGCSRRSGTPQYHSRLAAKLCHLLRVLGRKRGEIDGLDLEEACQVLQETLLGRSILVVLDDVWEPDIIARFTRLYDNECRFLATTRNQAVYETTTEAEKVEIGTEDVSELSRGILMQHSQLSEEELPEATTELLIQRCGHHPLTLAVLGKALFKETRPEQWDKALDDLSTYAAQAPVPVHYLNDKEAESAATVFGSFDYSLHAMTTHARDLFLSLAALCWATPIPEPCLEAIWQALHQDTTFRIVSSKLCDSSLLKRSSSSGSDTFLHYTVHDMVALFLETKTEESIALLLKEHSLIHAESRAAIVPWLYRFGNRRIVKLAEDSLVEVFWSNSEELPAIVLWNVVEVLSTSSTMAELEAASIGFSRILGPELARLFLLGFEDLHAAVARCVANCFARSDYERHTFALVQAGAPEKLAVLVRNHEEFHVRRDAAMVLARLAEFRHDACEEIMREVPLKEVVELLDPRAEETHNPVIDSLMTLARAGEEVAVREIFLAGAGKKLEEMLLSGSEIAQQRAIVALKSFHELGGSSVQGFLRGSGILLRRELPWQAKLSLERLTVLDRKSSFNQRSSSSAPAKRHWIAQKVAVLRDGSEIEQLRAIQELAPAMERAEAGDPQLLDSILSTSLIEVLAAKLDQAASPSPASSSSRQIKHASNRIKSEACFALVKLSAGGSRCIKVMIKAKVVDNLVVAMACSASSALQEAAYSALHNLVFTGRRLVTDQILRGGGGNLVDRVLGLLDAGFQIGLYCVQDLVEIGGKDCIERLLAARVVERLVALEGNSSRMIGGGKFRDSVVEFAKLVGKSSGLSAQEHRVLNSQLVRHARAAVKDPKQMGKITSVLKTSYERGEGSGSGSSGSGSGKRRNSFAGSHSSAVNF
ncbi:uncharacterized protein LOC9634115 [Selaginella moellendorffii]|uniref:uncharacterized protein LOC9634115 n=1 Tax=Selaginella moellendorffii TaxID=88036 RepID=UPI000D1CB8DE|nr:uncharacterized protein LOC9634115 [Selaginella moellendorffii]|eukprot:XP_024540053.1 uncharacterized protein LOC9634115 [Selaginella moellendorffii]